MAMSREIGEWQMYRQLGTPQHNKGLFGLKEKV
jgi:hypothetical protein